jgi:hypothetical protein
MSVLDPSLVPDADANRLAAHDKILIVDLARRSPNSSRDTCG